MRTRIVLILLALLMAIMACKSPSSAVGWIDGGAAHELQGDYWFYTAKPLTLKQLEGRVILIDVWQITCESCREEIPSLTSFYDQYKDEGLIVIGHHIGNSSETRDLTRLQNEMVELKINYVVLQDVSQDNWYARDTLYVPRYYLIDRQGILRYRQLGPNTQMLEEAILELLNEPVGSYHP